MFLNLTRPLRGLKVNPFSAGTDLIRRPNVFDVGPTLYKCYTNVFCLLGETIIVISN